MSRFQRAAAALVRAYKAIGPLTEDFMPDRTWVKSSEARNAYWISYDAEPSIAAATSILLRSLGSYPQDQLQERLTALLLKVKDDAVAIPNVHARLVSEVTQLDAELRRLYGWNVVHVVKGLPYHAEPFEVAGVKFGRMTKDGLGRWGQRFCSQDFNPPPLSPIPLRWFEQEATFENQQVAIVEVQASDTAHAVSESAHAIFDALNLLRYAQMVTSVPTGPFPEFGATANGRDECDQDHVLVARLIPGDVSVQHRHGHSGADLEYSKRAPAFSELEAILAVPLAQRTEMQTRLTFALEWVGQAALAPSLAVRIVSLTTALEAMLIDKHEFKRKAPKLKTRGSTLALSSSAWQFSESDVQKVYDLRSGCVHGARSGVTPDSAERAMWMIAILFDVLTGSAYKGFVTLQDVLGEARKLHPGRTIE